MPARTSAWSSASSTRIIRSPLLPPAAVEREMLRAAPCPARAPSAARTSRRRAPCAPPCRPGRGCAPFAARARTESRSKPRPSSRTESASRPPAVNRRSHRLRARAWRSTLLIASCATRKHAVSVSGASSGGASLGFEMRVQAGDARLAVEVRAQRGGQAEVVELRRAQAERELAHALERVLRGLDASRRRASAARARRPARASDSSWIFSAVSACPTSSCRSRARRRAPPPALRTAAATARAGARAKPRARGSGARASAACAGAR